MKKKYIAASAAALVILIAGIAILLFINTGIVSESAAADLYFMNEDGTSIIAEPCELRYKDDADLARTVIEKLRKGPSASKHGRIMPRATKLQRIEFTDEYGVIVDFSTDFLSEDPSKNVLSVYAVTKSLCSTGIVTNVMVTINGACISDRDGNQLGFITASDINLETEEYQSEMREVVLYFGDRSSTQLVKETRTIKITDQQPIEQYIINELIKGPDDKTMQAVLSKSTVLMSVDVEDNICYLSFRSSFLKENAGDSNHEKQVIYSIVNSLTELNTISRVQFYMDGKRVDKFGSFNLKGYIARDTSIIADDK
ncbi:MAG: GerMN domain-containing protein [Candidatus Ornithomonoglobus sp.]